MNRLLGGAGEEGLVGAGAEDAVEGELAGVLCAELEEQAGAVGGFGVDGVDQAKARRAVRWLASVTLFSANSGSPCRFICATSVTNSSAWPSPSGVRRVNEGGCAAVAERISGELFVEHAAGQEQAEFARGPGR